MADGNATFGDAPLTVLSDDQEWRGPVTLQRGTAIQVPANARLNLFGAIDDATNPLGGPGPMVRTAASTTRGMLRSKWRAGLRAVGTANTTLANASCRS